MSPLLLLFVPLLLPLALRPLPRYAVQRLAPAPALYVLTASSLALAATSVIALGTLMLTGLLTLPALSRFAELIRPLQAPSGPIVLPMAAAATGALALNTCALSRWTLRQLRAYRTATREADHLPAAGDLCVIESPHPDAYALPGRPHRVVVTTAMLRSLDAAERDALLAHERAHNQSRHHYFLAAAELAAHCHPALRASRTVIRFAVERVADESAAQATGDRRLTARAIARAALVTHTARSATSARPDFAPAAATGPVPQRVAALLAPAPRARAARWIAVLLACCAALSVTAGAVGALAFHHQVEVAQGEATR
ncbi:M56 family metallopeptidase [Streptomyces sp. MNP-20]|uniref:M56 family metallopeptidase n=1 Tax=Streptomyces sp. MNP-20 TaxID=2721165 RepID=UPI0015540F4D|nr:M56 family metallopeptidase [Streptomyces sp. MNP-20]